MKKILPLILFLFVAATCFAGGIEGTWKAKMQGGDAGEMELTFVFKMVDNKLTGTIKTPNGDMEITNTKVDGKDFSFDVSFNDSKITHKCKLNDDDTISLKVEGSPMGDMQMTLKRQQ